MGVELPRGKYIMEMKEGQNWDVFYRGRCKDSLAKLFPHEFIARHPPGNKDRKNNAVLSLRIRENGFKLVDKTVVPIPDDNGRFFYSNVYDPALDGLIGSLAGGIKKLDGESMLRDLEEEGL